MEWLPFWVTIGLWGAGLLLLWSTNASLEERYRQWWTVPCSLLSAAALIIIYLFFQDQVAPFLQPAYAWLQALGLDQPALTFANFIILCVNAALLIGFVVAKTLARVGAAFRDFFRKKDNHEPDLGWIHIYSEQVEEVRIRPKWVFPGKLARWTGWALGGLLLLVATANATLPFLPVLPLPLATLVFPIIPAIILLELGWYLDGILHVEAPAGTEDFSGEAVKGLCAAKFENLHEEYTRTWKEHCLRAVSDINLHRSFSKPDSNPRLLSEKFSEAEIQYTWNAIRSQLPGEAITGQESLVRGILDDQDIIVQDAIYDDLHPILSFALQRTIMRGENVLVLAEPDQRSTIVSKELVARQIRRWFQHADLMLDETVVDGAIVTNGESWSVLTLSDYLDLRGEPNVLVSSATDVIASAVYDDPWFKEVGLIVVLNATTTAMAHIASMRSIINILRSKSKDGPQVIVTTDNREEIESGIRTTIPADYGEVSLQAAPPEKLYVVAWQLQPTAFQEVVSRSARGHKRLLARDNTYYGAEPVLSLYAVRDKVEEIVALGQEEQAWDEHVEELSKNDELRAQVWFKRRALAQQEVSWMTDYHECPVLLIRDQNYNLISAFRRFLPVGKKAVLAHSVSPPYLLRDYFAKNLEYFLRNSDLALAISPHIDTESPYVVAYELLERMAKPSENDDWMEEEEILDLIGSLFQSADVMDNIHKLFVKVFDIDLDDNNYLEARSRYLLQEKMGGVAIQKVREFRFLPDIKSKEMTEKGKLSWLRRFEITDQTHTQGYISADHVTQYFLPGQVHAFRSDSDEHYKTKPYRIERIDRNNDKVIIVHEEGRSEKLELAYRPKLDLEVQDYEAISESETEVRVDQDVVRVVTKYLEVSFEVSTTGYWEFKDHCIEPSNADFRKREEKRSYVRGRGFLLEVTPVAGTEETGDFPFEHVELTLALLISEALPTFFPETYQLLHVIPFSAVNQQRSDKFAHVFPSCKVKEKTEGEGGGEPTGPETESPEEAKNIVRLLFVEDSHADVGLATAVKNRHDRILKHTANYLHWCINNRSSGAGDFLKYGESAFDEKIDFENTLGLLRRMGHEPSDLDDGEPSRASGPSVSKRPGDVQCDICYLHMPEASVEVLDDGRKRCKNCRDSAIDTPDELKNVYAEARQFLVDTIGVNLTRDISIHFATPREINEASGRLPTSTSHAIGLAIRRGEEYSILIEKGRPYHMTLATTAHELTHIWQYTHLDYAKLEAYGRERGHEKLLVEGHAVWAGMGLLKQRELNEVAPVACYIERYETRDDAYGKGYRHVLDLVKNDIEQDHPFTWVEAQFTRRD